MSLKSCVVTILGVIIQMNATEQYVPVVLFIMLHEVVLTFESVNKILKCDHSSESYWAVLSCGTIYYVVQGGSNFWVWMKFYGVTIQTKRLEHCFHMALFISKG